MSADVESIKAAFFAEATELLASLETGLLALADARPDAESVNALFRAMHTIKGSAGLFGLRAIVELAHVAEGLLEKLRAAPETMTEAHRVLLLTGHDELARLVELSSRGESPSVDPAVLAKFGTPSAAPAASPTPAGPQGAQKLWRIRAALNQHTLKDGMDPLSFLRYLQGLGTIEKLSSDLSKLPAGDDFDPELNYLSNEVELRTAADRATLEGVFEFVREGSTLEISPVAEVAAAPNGPTAPVAAHPQEAQLKVVGSRLDTLVDLVGELVVASVAANVVASRARDAATIESLAVIDRLVSNLRDAALSLRMVAIGDTFARFPRVVREVSAKLGKEVELLIKGGETELDKAMVARLSDPLLHIVRNALDHGLETAEVRKAAGKNPRGTLCLEASHDAGQIVIRVRDDGAGLKREKIRSIAVAKGLVAPDAQLSDAEVVELIFRPGFSSADQVSELSGRGVGMDVVRRTVTELRGSIDVRSVEGQGTELTMRLPLTLAIIDGFRVEAGGTAFVLPHKQVSECLDLSETLDSESHHRLNVRGEPVPFLRLREHFELEGERPARESVVIVRNGDQRLGIVVDRLDGALQAVIKPLGKIFSGLKGVGGTTVMGTGAIAFILDVAGLMSRVSRHSPVVSHPGAQA